MKAEDIDLELALRYMGVRDRENNSLLPLVKSCLNELVNSVSPRYHYRLFKIEEKDNGISVDGTELLLTGDSIKNHLFGCSECVLLCATLSIAADNLIRRYSTYDMTRSFILDCLGSAAVEAICDEAETDMREKINGRYFTWRYSPGYGDLPLELQPVFLRVLNSQKLIGLNVTENCMLVPSKSVTAVIGVSDDPIPRKSRGCLDCNNFNTCSFRKGGLHCGI